MPEEITTSPINLFLGLTVSHSGLWSTVPEVDCWPVQDCFGQKAVPAACAEANLSGLDPSCSPPGCMI